MGTTFTEMFDRQHKLTEEVLRSQGLTLGALTDRQRIDITKEYLLCLHKEVDEVLDSLDWKRHRKLDTPVYDDGVKEEIIDVQKYLWGLADIWGMGVEDYVAAFHRKSFVVEERWRMEQSSLQVPLLVCDIDGVLFQHTESFLEWLRENRPALEGLSKVSNPTEWEIAKEAYRTSGAKQSGLGNQGNIDVLHQFKNRGWTIVCMTYRPKHVFKSLEYDTLLWLKNSDVPVDKIIWAAYEKHLYVQSVVNLCTVFIDDDYETCVLMAALGRKVYWLTNSPKVAPVRVTKVHNLTDVYNAEYHPERIIPYTVDTTSKE